MTADVKRVPRRYSVVAVVLCCADIASNGLLELHHDWSVRGVQMGVAAVACGLAYWVFRRFFLGSLGVPLPRRGLSGRLATLPGWLVIVAFLAGWLVVLAITAAALAILHLSGEAGALLGMGIVLLLVYWAQAAALLERRRQGRIAG